MSNTRVKLALYRGPGHTLLERATHTLTTLVVSARKLRLEHHSHAELVIDDVSYSSSLRDRGVRSKLIEFGDSWDIYPVEMTDTEIDAALDVFYAVELAGYDTEGALAWAVPSLLEDAKRLFCFELVAKMLGMPNASRQSALDLLAYVKNLNAARPRQSVAA